jgi:two-component system sensor histidine kinase SenX3
MSVTGTQLSASRRPKWLHITVGVVLIVVAVTLTVFFQILGGPNSQVVAKEAQTARFVLYFLGTVLFTLLIGGLGLLIVLLLREVRLNERQSNFVSAVTHELKTPVSSLKLYLDTLRLRDLPESRRDDFYKTMSEDIERLTATINNVLHAAMYTDRSVADPQPVNLARVVNRAIDLTLTRNQLSRDAIRYQGPESLAVRGNGAALETAVLNLLDNAVKYSKDRVDVEVEVTADLSGQAIVRVRDQGIGMTRAHLRFIFNRFYRIGSEARRSRPGIGLGLFIVKSVAKGHKGTVMADSPGPDRGSTFTLTLPTVVEDLGEAS